MASQPTLSRFENLATPAVLQKLIDFTINTGIERLKQKHGGRLPASITLDLDATDDPTHGHQQLTLFHGYFGQYQYFPLIISEPTTKHVFVAWLRPGTVHASLGAEDDLMRVVNALRKERPDIAIHVRGDAGFGLPRMYEICEQNNLTYTFGFATNPRLKKRTEPLMNQAVEQHQQTQQKQRLFDCFPYQADTWDHPRTLIAKAECHSIGTNLRFVITNVANVVVSDDGQREYDHYIQRGESEQRMDELKNGLHMDRLSCHRFMANFFVLLLHTAAFNLLQRCSMISILLESAAGRANPAPGRSMLDQGRRRHRAAAPTHRGETRGQLALVDDVPICRRTRFELLVWPMIPSTTCRPAMGVRGRCTRKTGHSSVSGTRHHKTRAVSQITCRRE